MSHSVPTRFLRSLFAIVTTGLILSFSGSASLAADSDSDINYIPIMWTDLLPYEDLQALLNPEPILHYGDEAPSRQTLDRDNRDSSPFEQALVSTNINHEFVNQNISLPGFVVPLEFDEKQRVTEFFLVPYFGACIHVPAPPPNQIVFVSYPKGLDFASIYDAYNVDGKLVTETTTNSTASSVYKIEASKIYLYEYD